MKVSKRSNYNTLPLKTFCLQNEVIFIVKTTTFLRNFQQSVLGEKCVDI